MLYNDCTCITVLIPCIDKKLVYIILNNTKFLFDGNKVSCYEEYFLDGHGNNTQISRLIGVIKFIKSSALECSLLCIN